LQQPRLLDIDTAAGGGHIPEVGGEQLYGLIYLAAMATAA
jgi:hypothetical protein